MRSTTSSSTPKRVDHVSFPRPSAGSVSATALRTHRCRRADPRPRGPAGAAGRLGPPPPRPGRTRLHRPARPRGAGAALLQSRTGRRPRSWRVRRRREPRRSSSCAGTVALRPEAVARRRSSPRARSRCTSPISRSWARRRRRRFPWPGRRRRSWPAEELRLKHRVLDLRRPELQRNLDPPPPAAAARPPDADRAGLSRDRDADPHEADARRRARLPGAEPHSPGRVLRAAAVAADLQAAADGGGLRPLLPDRALLPRRGSPGRPAAGVHPDRPRGVVRLRRGHPARRRADPGAICGRRAGVEVSAPFPRLAWREAMERYGIDKPDLRYGLELRDLTALLGADAAPFLAEARGEGRPAPRDRAARRRGAHAGRISTRSRPRPRRPGRGGLDLGAARRGRLGRAGGQGGRPGAARARWAARRATSCSPSPGRTRSPPPRCTPCARRSRVGRTSGRRTAHAFAWIVDFPLFELDPETGRHVPAHHPFTAPHPADRDSSTPIPAGSGRCTTTPCTTATSSAAARSGSPIPTVQRRIFELLGIPEAEIRRRFGFLLDGLAAGAPPHGGFALGFDRITMLLAGRTVAAGRDRVSQDHGGARAVRGRADAGGPGRSAGAAPEARRSD